jgi:alpha-L-fucosidase
MRRRDALTWLASAAAAGFVNGRPLDNGERARSVAAQQGSAHYTSTWDSLDARPMPGWYTDAKFGIFIHWGVYSVPAYAAVNVKDENPYAEWYWNSLTSGMNSSGATGHGALTWAFHKRVYGPDFPYFDFAPQFRAELYDPDRWAGLIAQSGARYVALTSKHHEGFTLWRSAQANHSWGRPWNAVDIGPKRDVLLDLMEAGRGKGLHMGIYYSLYEWYNPLWLSDKQKYVTDHLFPQFKDVVTHAKPAIIFSDGEWELTSTEWRSPELLAWLFNESPVADHVVIDDRWGSDTRHKHGGYYTTEYTSGMQESRHPWEESRGMGFSYGYNRAETLADYRTSRELILMLIDIVSRGGNLLLDIGPRADGVIPVVMEERLVQIGDWLRPNGEAIYGSTSLKRPAQWSAGQIPHLEQKEFRAEYHITQMVDNPPAGYAHIEAFFTQKNANIYAILPRWPQKDLVLHDFAASAATKATLIGRERALSFEQRGRDLVIAIPDSLRASEPPQEAYVIRMTGVHAL